MIHSAFPSTKPRLKLSSNSQETQIRHYIIINTRLSFVCHIITTFLSSPNWFLWDEPHIRQCDKKWQHQDLSPSILTSSCRLRIIWNTASGATCTSIAGACHTRYRVMSRHLLIHGNCLRWVKKSWAFWIVGRHTNSVNFTGVWRVSHMAGYTVHHGLFEAYSYRFRTFPRSHHKSQFHHVLHTIHTILATSSSTLPFVFPMRLANLLDYLSMVELLVLPRYRGFTTTSHSTALKSPVDKSFEMIILHWTRA